MIICGINTTHDAAIALVDNGRLVFCWECEKIDNNPRHSSFILRPEQIMQVLSSYGYALEKIDRFVLDGWSTDPQLSSTDEDGGDFLTPVTLDGGASQMLRLAPYGQWVQNEDVLAGYAGKVRGVPQGYRSYMHVAGHIFGAYCTSPFAATLEPSLVLVWDGGMPPQLFYYDPARAQVQNLGALFPLEGAIYISFPHAFAPFNEGPSSFSIAGKAMAYVALGKSDPIVRKALRDILRELINEGASRRQSTRLLRLTTMDFVYRASGYAAAHGIPHVDMLASFHTMLEEELLEALARKLGARGGPPLNLCFAGGCALNIKWNAALRASGLFREVWVPPFPNDSGNAIGTACCEMIHGEKRHGLDWNVYAGPPLSDTAGTSDPMWSRRSCSPAELAQLMHETGEPVVFLHGPAELGPRALGHRSILAPAHSPRMKQLLNDVKGREHYRPVAPICLEERAPEVFEPGSPDPYMLFEHIVREPWVTRVPAIRHVDGTARLQTVNSKQNPLIHQLLTHYYALSGVPVLCNTSANLRGRGFFPDVRSAMQWGQLNHIWSEGTLHSRKSPIPLMSGTAQQAQLGQAAEFA